LVRDEAIDQRKRYYCRDLFKRISGEFSPDCVSILTEWINSQDEVKLITISELLAEAKSEFIFKNIEFIEQLLINSKIISENCFMVVQENLLNIAQFGLKSRTLHQPSPVDVKNKETAEELAKSLQEGSILRNFILSLAENATMSINRAIQEDEYLLDE
jgi:hypothetical protein